MGIQSSDLCVFVSTQWVWRLQYLIPHWPYNGKDWKGKQKADTYIHLHSNRKPTSLQSLFRALLTCFSRALAHTLLLTTFFPDSGEVIVGSHLKKHSNLLDHWNGLWHIITPKAKDWVWFLWVQHLVNLITDDMETYVDDAISAMFMHYLDT